MVYLTDEETNKILVKDSLRRGKKMKKKPYKIIESELFKKQMKGLSVKAKKEIDKALISIAKHPMKTPNSMDLFTPPSAEELKQWMGRVKPVTVDLVIEYLFDKHCLNMKGMIVARKFHKKYIEKVE